MKAFTLSKDLLLGSATAATQIEGGDKNCNWYHWSLQNKIKNNESSLQGCDHYNRVDEDIAIMNTLHQQTYRMSIEWSRIFPKKNIASPEGIAHYRDELQKLKESGIIPLITLLHFSCPQWVEEEGAWLNPKAIDYFLDFVHVVIRELGDLATDYCTINEPNVFLNSTYMDNEFPGGMKDKPFKYFKAAKNLIKAHLKAYKLIHHIRSSKGYEGATKVGIAHHIAVLHTNSKNPLTKLSRNFMDYSFHTLFLKGMVEGKISLPIGFPRPAGKGIFCDFIGVNYYSRHLIKSSKNMASLCGELTVDDTRPKECYNDLGWEIYPQGITEVISKVYNTYKLPIYITENGICDAKDDKRALFLYDHLKEVQKMIDAGINIERYYHWSLLDNFEWNDGYGPQFGLTRIDYSTMERHIRPSGYFYGEICKTHAISDEMIKEYIS